MTRLFLRKGKALVHGQEVSERKNPWNCVPGVVFGKPKGPLRLIF